MHDTARLPQFFNFIFFLIWVVICITILIYIKRGGFYLEPHATKSLTLSLTIGGVDIRETLDIHPGEFVYFFKTTVYPIIAITCSETHLNTECYEDLSVIYALINDTNNRKKIAQSTNIINNNIIVRGTFNYVDDMEKYLIAYPDYNNLYIRFPDFQSI